MNSDRSHSARHKRQFNGCIELIPPQPKFIEFVTDNHLFGIAFHQFDSFILSSIPKPLEKNGGPPDLLILIFKTRTVVLFGWRLELMAGPLVSGQIARVHAEKHLGPLMIEEAWVTDIKISPRFDPSQI